MVRFDHMLFALAIRHQVMDWPFRHLLFVYFMLSYQISCINFTSVMMLSFTWKKNVLSKILENKKN